MKCVCVDKNFTEALSLVLSSLVVSVLRQSTIISTNSPLSVDASSILVTPADSHSNLSVPAVGLWDSQCSHNGDFIPCISMETQAARLT